MFTWLKNLLGIKTPADTIAASAVPEVTMKKIEAEVQKVADEVKAEVIAVEAKVEKAVTEVVAKVKKPRVKVVKETAPAEKPAKKPRAKKAK